MSHIETCRTARGFRDITSSRQSVWPQGALVWSLHGPSVHWTGIWWQHYACTLRYDKHRVKRQHSVWCHSGKELKWSEMWVSRVVFCVCVGACSGVMHGKSSLVYHTQKGVLENMTVPFQAARYHSLVISRDGFPHEELEVVLFIYLFGHTSLAWNIFPVLKMSYFCADNGVVWWWNYHGRSTQRALPYSRRAISSGEHNHGWWFTGNVSKELIGSLSLCKYTSITIVIVRSHQIVEKFLSIVTSGVQLGQ